MKLIPASLTLLIIHLAFSVAGQEKPNTYLYGNIHLKDVKTIYLYANLTLEDYLENQDKRLLDSMAVDSGGTYRFGLPIEKLTEFHLKHNYDIFKIFYGRSLSLSPGDSLRLDYAETRDTAFWECTGRGSEAYKYASGFYNVFLRPEFEVNAKYRSPFQHLGLEEFKTYTDERKNQQLSFLDSFCDNGTLNHDFYEHQKKKITLQAAYDRLCYPFWHVFINRMVNPEDTTLPKYRLEVDESYYTFPDILNSTDSGLLDVHYYKLYVSAYTLMQITPKLQDIPDEDTLQKELHIKNAHVSRCFVADSILCGMSRDISYAMAITYELAESKEGPNNPRLDTILSKYQRLTYSPRILAFMQNKVNEFRSSFDVDTIYDFTLTDTSGNPVKLSDFRGKVVYIDFWMVGCAPCIKEIPSSNKLQEQLKDKEVVFLTISFDESIESWKNMIKWKNFQGLHLNGSETTLQNAVMDAFLVTGFPKYTILDRSGRIAVYSAGRPSDMAYKDILKVLGEGPAGTDN